MALPGAEELAPGLRRWVAYHPEWKQDVACLAYAKRPDLVLVDPMLPADAGESRRFLRALDREVRGRERPLHVLVTIHWHKRHAAEIADRYRKRPGVELWGPGSASEKLGLAANRALERVRRLPAGIVAVPCLKGEEVVLWLPAARAVFAGDVLLGGKRRPLRVCPQSWLPRGVERAAVAKELRPLTTLPVELVVPAHGEPVREDAALHLRRAIADAA